MAKDRDYKQFFAILNKMPKANREDIVSQYTGGRTSSLREMGDKEYKMMIDSLNARLKNQEASAAQELVLRTARSKVLFLMMEMGFDTRDWNKIDAFCLHKRIAGKRFYYLSVSELEGLRKKLRSMRDKGYKYQRPKARVMVIHSNNDTPS